MIKRKHFLAALSAPAWACALAWTAGSAWAQAAPAAAGFPSQPVRLVVPAAPGGGTDLMARILANAITQNAGWTVVVDNKAGASGIIGADFVAKAKPDGYTLGMGLTATLSINPELFQKLPYDVLRDYTPVVTVSSQPVVLVVRADSPFKSVADLVAAHKTRPLTLATGGQGTVGQLVGEMFGQTLGARFTPVPYKGTAPAIQDLAAGQTDGMFSTPPAALPLIQGGRLRALAVTSAKRLPLLPEVPTMVEAGFAGFEASESKVLVAPAGTPPEVVARINAEVQKALSQPAVIGRIISDGSLPSGGTPQQAQAFVKSELARWTAAVRGSGLSKTN